MKKTFKIIVCTGIIYLISMTSYAQSFPLKKFDSDINTSKSTPNLNANTANTKVVPNANIDLNINKNLNTNAVNNSMNKYATKHNGNFLMETLPEDEDIKGRRYLNNEDITHKRIGTNMDLGTISTTSKTVRVVCRDHSYVDGDMIKIFINEVPLKNNVVLKGSSFSVYLNLNEGFNRIDFQALNQGLSGPNTAELKLYDENDNLIAAKEWNLLTGGVATIGVIQK